MTIATLSPRELEPQLAQILERYRDDMEQAPRPVAFHADVRWTGPAQLEIKGLRFRIAEARSVLALREALIRHPGDDVPLVLTPLSEQDLPQDTRARLLRFRLFPVDAWEAVKSLFRATAVDPRLRDRTLAEALLANAPPDGYPPVPAGVLDADSAWRALYRSALGMGGRVPEGRDLLRWAASPEARIRYVDAGEAFRKAVRDHFLSRLGRSARVVFQALDAGRGQDLLEFALLCDLLEEAWSEQPHRAEVVAARAEYLVGNLPLAREDIQAVAADARAMLEEGSAPGLEASRLNNFDSLLQSLRAVELSHLSRYSPMGFEERLLRLADALLDAGASSRVSWARLEAVRRHRRAEGLELLIERCEALVRLAGWLRESRPISAAPLLELSRAYLEELVWVDRARELLAAADLGSQLSRAARALLEQVVQRREAFNRAFATQLVTDLEHETLSPACLPIERVLEAVVAPQAKDEPVLLVVLDGMSWPVAITLAEDLRALDWELLGMGSSSLPIVLATVPTVTEFSRTSLLCGTLKSGQASTEKAGFRTHVPLLQVSKPGVPPRLFHKDELSEDGRGGLAAAVREAVADPAQRIVAVVVNAVDDRLKGALQVDSRWQLEAITPLRTLLEAAAEAGRRVILTSDHGHVWEDASRRLTGGESERWRSATGAMFEEELRVRGARLEQLTGSREIYAPWSERVRYAILKAGYHGGLTPQEVLVPLIIAMPGTRVAKELTPLELLPPAWWSPTAGGLPSGGATATAPVAQPVAEARAKRAAKEPATSSLPLFPGLAASESASVRARAEVPGAKLLERLLTSEVMKEQVKLAGRHVPEEAALRELLEPLIERGGRLPVRGLAATLKLPEHRLHGLLAQVMRLLNVDGLPILTIDRAENMVRLELDQLRAQFELKGA